MQGLKKKLKSISHKICCILGNIASYSINVKEVLLVIIVFLFFLAMIFLAVEKAFSEVIAMAGILVGIISSPIFLISSQIQKHKVVTALEKKRAVYQKILNVTYELIRSLNVKAFGFPFFKETKLPDEFFKITRVSSCLISQIAKNSLYISNEVARYVEEINGLCLKFTNSESDLRKCSTSEYEKKVNTFSNDIQNVFRKMRSQMINETIK